MKRLLSPVGRCVVLLILSCGIGVCNLVTLPADAPCTFKCCKRTPKIYAVWPGNCALEYWRFGSTLCSQPAWCAWTNVCTNHIFNAVGPCCIGACIMTGGVRCACSVTPPIFPCSVMCPPVISTQWDNASCKLKHH